MICDFNQAVLANRKPQLDQLGDESRRDSRRVAKRMLGYAFADLSQTAGSVATVSGAISHAEYTAGATITAGTPVYRDTNNVWQKAQADSAAHMGSGQPLGIMLSDTVSGRLAIVQTGGVINVGATLTVGVLYGVSAANAGKIAPITDLASTNIFNILGVAKSSSQLDMSLNGLFQLGYIGIVLP